MSTPFRAGGQPVPCRVPLGSGVFVLAINCLTAKQTKQTDKSKR